MNIGRLEAAGCLVLPKANLSEFTTFRLGGTCPWLVHCFSAAGLAETIREARRHHLPFRLIGGGSNLLVSDAGLDEVVICFKDNGRTAIRDGNVLELSGAMPLDAALLYAAEEGLEGLTFASGIPGTVGGAVTGNAGAFGKQIGDRVESVTLMDDEAVTRREPASLLGFGYRGSRLQDGRDVVVSVRLRMDASDPAVLKEERAEILQLRREKHPDWHTVRTAGSFFKNIEPTSAAERRQAAGWFLEQAGAKSMRVGGARVFEKHANIIVAENGCTAQDVLDLSRGMAAAVLEKFQLTLVPEVRVLGSFR